MTFLNCTSSDHYIDWHTSIIAIIHTGHCTDNLGTGDTEDSAEAIQGITHKHVS
jgi:hypothetical protein